MSEHPADTFERNLRASYKKHARRNMVKRHWISAVYVVLAVLLCVIAWLTDGILFEPGHHALFLGAGILVGWALRR